MKHLIERLNLVMKELKLTSNALAIQANISPSNFRKMLLGEQKITDRTLNLISEKFGINLVWLKTGEGEMLLDNNSMLPNADIQEGIDIPIEVISQALGHSYGLAVTQGYIMPDRRKVDEANRKILDLLK